MSWANQVKDKHPETTELTAAYRDALTQVSLSIGGISQPDPHKPKEDVTVTIGNNPIAKAYIKARAASQNLHDRELNPHDLGQCEASIDHGAGLLAKKLLQHLETVMPHTSHKGEPLFSHSNPETMSDMAETLRHLHESVNHWNSAVRSHEMLAYELTHIRQGASHKAAVDAACRAVIGSHARKAHGDINALREGIASLTQTHKRPRNDVEKPNYEAETALLNCCSDLIAALETMQRHGVSVAKHSRGQE